MPRLVKGPDGAIHSFPDDATDLEISQALEAHPEKPKRTWGEVARDSLAAIGGTVGAIAGGPVGAAFGGSAGEGYRQLATHAKEIPGAVVDVAHNLIENPEATVRGFDEGARSGALGAGMEGAIQGATDVVGGVVTKGIGKLGTAVYRGYVKPSLANVGLDKARDIIATGIREWLPVTAGGEARAARLIGQINGQVEAYLKNSAERVDLHGIADRVRAFARKTFYKPGAPMEDFEAAMKVAEEIDAHPSLALPPGAVPTRVEVPVVQGNQVKQALDTAIGDTGFGVERTAATEARKVGRHAAREAIETKVPGVGPLNARESKLIDAMEAIKKAAGREENKNPLTGWGTTIVAGGAGGASYAKTGDPTAALLSALAVRGLITPAVASRAAILAAKFGESKAGAAVTSNALRMGLILAQRESEREQ